MLLAKFYHANIGESMQKAKSVILSGNENGNSTISL
jgi:hypothetical protein